LFLGYFNGDKNEDEDFFYNYYEEDENSENDENSEDYKNAKDDDQNSVDNSRYMIYTKLWFF